MSCCPCQCKEAIRARAIELGAVACGFAKANEVDAKIAQSYNQWLGQGCNGTMAFCERYCDVRNDPRLLLDGATTVISCAFPYHNTLKSKLPGKVASYAMGRDYHLVIRQRLALLAQFVAEQCGGDTRVAVDTAPIYERYWAVRAGIGFIGLNHQLIVPSAGSYVFIGEIITTAEIAPDESCVDKCLQCGKCIRQCKSGALSADGGFDARKCQAYLTIEHRGDISQPIDWIYGCDDCQRVCQHNAHIACEPLPEFNQLSVINNIDGDALAALSSNQFKKLTADSAMSRITLNKLRANIKASEPADD